MGLFELLVIAVGLSMDAFAVSVCKGLGMKKTKPFQTLVIGLFFGGFQAMMPLIGWALGKQFEQYIKGFDHWIAFCLLGFIGIKMIYEAFRNTEEPEICGESNRLNLKELFVLAVATSIDALAAGVAFAAIGGLSIWSSVAFIGLTTFLLSVVGVAVGSKFGARFEKKAEILGGAVLVLIGLKILLEHLGVLNF